MSISMKQLKVNKYILLGAVIVLALAAVLYVFAGSELTKDETFAEATSRCGKQPVIGSGGIYYAPGPSNKIMSYDLLSLYDPGNLDLSQFPDAKFYCSVDQAEAAGYEKHQCCGLGPVRP